MTNWRSQAASETGSQPKDQLKVGTYKDLKVLTVKPSDKFPGSWRLGVVSQSHEGWANLNLRLDQDWLNPALIAMAMGTSGSKEKGFTTNRKYVQQAQQDGVTATDVLAADKYMEDYATEQADKNNVPAERLDEELDRIKNSLLLQVKINIGTLWRLQEWAGVEVDENMNPEELKGTVFAGSVKERNQFLDVGNVYAVPKDYVAPKPETQFQPNGENNG